MSASPACRICAGTGKLVLMRSWFRTDGLRHERCGICAGTGISSYRSGSYEVEQRRFRAIESAMRGRRCGRCRSALNGCGTHCTASSGGSCPGKDAIQEIWDSPSPSRPDTGEGWAEPAGERT